MSSSGNIRTGLSGRPLACVAGQLGRPPHPISRVTVKCPWGCPAVVENLPYDAHGTPFPTLFYVTCPTLVSAIGAVESGGGVARFTGLAEADQDLAASLREAVAYERRRRRRLVRRFDLVPGDGGAALEGGVGGVADAATLKCLHAHGAHGLTRPRYVLGRLVVAEAGELWCADRRCQAGPASC